MKRPHSPPPPPLFRRSKSLPIEAHRSSDASDDDDHFPTANDFASYRPQPLVNSFSSPKRTPSFGSNPPSCPRPRLVRRTSLPADNVAWQANYDDGRESKRRCREEDLAGAMSMLSSRDAEEEKDDSPLPPLSLSGPLPNYATPTRVEEDHKCREAMKITMEKLVQAFTQASVKLLVVDLDMTLLNIHTNGEIPRCGSISEAASLLARNHIRTVFHVLIPLVASANIPIGIATFSTQETLIREMLTLAFANHGLVLDQNCFVRCSHVGRAIDQHEGLTFAHDAEPGKRQHICDIIGLVPGGHNIVPGQVLFIDDDPENIKVAKDDGHLTVKFTCDLSEERFLSECFASLTRMLLPSPQQQVPA